MTYGYDLIETIETGDGFKNVNTFFESQLRKIESETSLLASLDLTEPEASAMYQDELYTVMQHSEGATLGVMTYLYTFDYLRNDVSLEQLS